MKALIISGISLEELGDTVQISYLQPDEGSEVKLLGYNEALEWNYDEENGLTIQIPEVARSDNSLNTAWVFKITGSER